MTRPTDESISVTPRAKPTGGDLHGTPLAELLDVLAHERCRRAICVLRNEGRPMAISELAEWIVAAEAGREVTCVDPIERQHVTKALEEVHLPALAAVDLVIFDDENGIVQPINSILK